MFAGGWYTSFAPGDTNLTEFLLINIRHMITIDALYYMVGVASAGNVKMALYRDNGGIPDGGALIAQTASEAQPAADRIHIIPLTTAVQLISGLYWIAIQGDDAAMSYRRIYAVDPVGVGWGRFDNATTYANFPADPCPATFIFPSPPSAGVRVLSVP